MQLLLGGCSDVHSSSMQSRMPASPVLNKMPQAVWLLCWSCGAVLWSSTRGSSSAWRQCSGASAGGETDWNQPMVVSGGLWGPLEAVLPALLLTQSCHCGAVWIGG
jgi:hypothetical protein